VLLDRFGLLDKPPLSVRETAARLDVSISQTQRYERSGLAKLGLETYETLMWLRWRSQWPRPLGTRGDDSQQQEPQRARVWRIAAGLLAVVEGVPNKSTVEHLGLANDVDEPDQAVAGTPDAAASGAASAEQSASAAEPMVTQDHGVGADSSSAAAPDARSQDLLVAAFERHSLKRLRREAIDPEARQALEQLPNRQRRVVALLTGADGEDPKSMWETAETLVVPLDRVVEALASAFLALGRNHAKSLGLDLLLTANAEPWPRGDAATPDAPVKPQTPNNVGRSDAPVDLAGLTPAQRLVVTKALGLDRQEPLALAEIAYIYQYPIDRVRQLAATSIELLPVELGARLQARLTV